MVGMENRDNGTEATGAPSEVVLVEAGLTAAEQRIYFGILATHGNRAACKAVGRTWIEIHDWASSEDGIRAGFWEKRRVVQALTQESFGEELHELVHKAIWRVDKSLDSEDEAIALKAAHGILRGLRYYRERVESDVRAVGEVTIRVVTEDSRGNGA